MHALWGQRDIVPESVVGGLSLRKFAIRVLLGGVYKIGKFDRILDEEDRDIIADQVEIALRRIELDGKAANVPGQVERTLVAGNCRKAREHRNALSLILKEGCPGDVAQRLQAFEETMGRRPASMNHPLRDAFVIEMHDLLTQDEILEQDRAARADLERVLVVCDGHALVGRQEGVLARGLLMQFTAVPRRG